MRKYKLRYNKHLAFIFSIGLLVLCITGGAVFFPASGIDLTSSIDLESLLIGAPGASYAIMAAVGNINRAAERETTGSQIAGRVWLADVDGQIDDSLPFPKPNANGEVGTLPLLPGEFMHYCDIIDDSASDTSKGEKGDITTAVTNAFEFIIGGYRRNVQKFLEDHAGGRFIIIYQMNDDEAYYVIGTKMKPMILKSFERSNNKDSRSIKLVFENKSFQQPQKYIGTILREEPAVLAVDATDFTVSSNKKQYTTGVNTVATELVSVSGLTKDDETTILEIVGSGGAFPTTISENPIFILKDSVKWTGNAGSRISFRVLDVGTLTEASRIQT